MCIYVYVRVCTCLSTAMFGMSGIERRVTGRPQAPDGLGFMTQTQHKLAASTGSPRDATQYVRLLPFSLVDSSQEVDGRRLDALGEQQAPVLISSVIGRVDITATARFRPGQAIR